MGDEEAEQEVCAGDTAPCPLGSLDLPCPPCPSVCPQCIQGTATTVLYL